MKKSILSILFLLTGVVAIAQQKSPELFSVGNRSVSSEEFLHMYTKNQLNKKIDYSRKALEEYLDLYSLFKMKVSQAYELQLDTIPSVQREIDSYKKQLAQNYLTNRSVTERLIKEAYEREKKDVRVAHILITVRPNSNDTMMQWKQIDSIYRQIKKGKLSFEKAAQEYSYDKQSGAYGGDIGYFTALQVVYPFETAAYNLKKDEVSEPFRTVYGYHILKKLNERPARGQIQVAQIMTTVRKSEGEQGRKNARAKIDSAYAKLKAGKAFEDVEKKYNEDAYSKNAGGVLPVFGVGKMVSQYEDVAFALQKKGDFSEVIETENGFHIISLIKKIPLGAYEDERKLIEKLIQRDGRITVAQEAFVNELKQKLHYTQNDEALDELIAAIPDSTLRDGSFKGADYGTMTKTVFVMDGTNFTQADFANYIEVYTRGKLYGDKVSGLRSLLDNYAKKALMDYEESMLEQENPEYKSILQEYREGILIFELTKQKVWDKAPQDSVGLAQYFELNKEKYQWGPAVEGQIYTAKNEDYIKAVVKELNQSNVGTPSEIVKNVNGNGPQDKVSVEEGKFEMKRFEFNKPYEAGKYMPYYENKDGSYSLLMVDKVFNEPTIKTFLEARGYVISDYQDKLETEWKNELRAKYPLKLNKKEFNSLVK